MSKENRVNKQPNKFKIYGIAILIYLLINGLVIELLITLLENQLETPLFPMFPYTRIALLIITILIARHYISKRSLNHNKNPNLFIRIAKYAFLTLIFAGLALGAFLSVSFYDETPYEPIVFPELPVPEPVEVDRPNFEQ
jgi:hypothetical protein